MIVPLVEFKQELKRASVALKTGALDGGDGHIQLQFSANTLRVGAKGAALSYVGTVVGQGDETQAVYIPVRCVKELSPTAQKEIELTFDGADLHYQAGPVTGIVKTTDGMQHWAPYTKVGGDPYLLLRTAKSLGSALKMVAAVKAGWTTKTRPLPAGFVRLRTEIQAEDQDVCRLLVSPTTSDQDALTQYATNEAFTVFASDELRYFQAFEPIYPLPTAEEQHAGDFPLLSTLLQPKWAGKPLHLTLTTAAALSRVLPDAPVQVQLVKDGGRVKAITFFNSTTFVWVRASLHAYPDADFDQQLAYLNGFDVASFVPTKEFISAACAACDIPDTKVNGLTVRVESGRIHISSPEHGSSVRYTDIEADTFGDALTVVVNGEGVRAALKHMSGEITVVGGVEFLAFYNPTTASRIILRTYER